MSDSVVIANLIVTFLGTVFAGVMTYLMARLNRQQMIAAAKVDTVRVELHEVNAVNATALDEVKTVLARTDAETVAARAENAAAIAKAEAVREANSVAIAEIVNKVEEVHKATNSLTDRLVETTRAEAHAAGIKEQQEKLKGRPADPPEHP